MKKFLILLLALLLTGCTAAPLQPEPESTLPETTAETTAATETTVPETVPAPTRSPEEQLLDTMTVEQKAAQLFIVTPEALSLPQLPAELLPQAQQEVVENQLRQQLGSRPVGGILFFGGNLQSPEQLTAYTAMLRRCSPLPLFLAVDEEGGTVARLGNHPAFSVPKFPSAGTVGKSGDPRQAYQMGCTIGEYLQQYGFNLDFAPVADVNTNPKNPVIGRRAFSPEPETAAEMAAAMAQGLKEQGIIPTFKHFPGHGDTAQDSHTGIAVVDKSYEALSACEWVPFRQAGPDSCIMVGHIALPQITGDLTPATLSPEIVTGILRQDLGFQGLIVTDALQMGAITDRWSSAEAAELAFAAGCDLLLTPKNFEEAYRGILEAVRAGRISQARLDESVLRILRFKHKLLS